jgi:hypothetical protein
MNAFLSGKFWNHSFRCLCSFCILVSEIGRFYPVFVFFLKKSPTIIEMAMATRSPAPLCACVCDVILSLQQPGYGGTAVLHFTDDETEIHRGKVTYLS